MKHIIVGTAGHIDHGKSALVRALTGTDPDRLEEEKRRGITIDIGFATLDLGGEEAPDLRLGFVDVPGHEHFVRNMLAGIGGIDLVLFVVAADESIQPQTREHFDICRLLGIPKGIIVITKADLVEREILDLVRLELEEFVAGSFLDGAPILAASAKTGEGIEQLKQEMRRQGDVAPAKDSSGYFRLPIDREFVMKGFGPVVTGTLLAGNISVEQEAEVHPLKKRVRIRGIQVHSQRVQTAGAGQRTALNLAGIDPGELARGMTLTEPDRFQTTVRVDCALNLLPSAPPLKNGASVHFHCGTAEMIGRVILLEPKAEGQSANAVQPGTRAYVQFRLREPTLLLPGDAFIIRRLSPLATIGGGRVLDNWVPRQLAPSRRPPAAEAIQFLQTLEKGSREEILSLLLRRSPARCFGLPELITHTGWSPAQCSEAIGALVKRGFASILADNPLFIADTLHVNSLSGAALAALEAFHKANPLAPGISLEELRSRVFSAVPSLLTDAVLKGMAEQRKIAISGELVRSASHRIVLKNEEQKAKEQIAGAFEKAGLSAPSVQEVLAKLPIERQRAEKILQLLIQEKTLVRVSEDLVIHAEAARKLRQLLAQYKTQNSPLTVAAFKDLTQVSRKYAIPLLEYLDRERVTRRVGDARVLL